MASNSGSCFERNGPPNPNDFAAWERTCLRSQSRARASAEQRAALHPAFGFEEQRPADGGTTCHPFSRAAVGTQECDLEIGVMVS